MLVEKVENGLVAALVLLADLLVLEVGPRSHPAVDLGREGLNMVGNLQVVPVPLHVVRVLVLGRQHRDRCRHVLRVVGVQHGRVTLHTGLERDAEVLGQGQVGDFGAPAVAQDPPFLEAVPTGGQLVRVRHDARDLGQREGRRRLGLEEVAQLLLVLVRLGRVPRDIGGAALEEVGDEHAVLPLSVGGCQDVGTLDGLWPETEDV